jgi:cysteine-rich repeat protein
MHARRSIAVGFALALALALSQTGCSGCGSGGTETPDAPPPDSDPGPDGVPQDCGNLMVEGTEQCDDGNEDPGDGCVDCAFECGNGMLDLNEACDSAIPSGNPGACPTDLECTDQDPCTTGVVSGAGCQVVCDFATITAPINDDLCCPVGQDMTTDNDCMAICGNGVVEMPSEDCDTGITAGNPGACPTSCDDGQACTTDNLANPGTCQAACTNTPITMPINNDGCCAGTPMNDNDCMGCGDGVVTPPETCDTAITMGMGVCPTACNDMMACTTDVLLSPGTCSAACAFTPITMIGPDDGCCPPGGNANTDPNCMPVCGNGVMEMGEACDDGNTNNNDSCNNMCQTVVVTTAFRFTDLDVRDPHIFATVPIFGCTDVTDFMLFGIDGVNPTLQTNIQTDDDMDGQLELSIANTFSPLVQTAGMSTSSDLVFPDCTAPMSSTSCTLPAGAPHTVATASNLGGAMNCLGTIPMTTGGYSPAVVVSTAPAGGTCYSANAGTVTFSLGGIPITLEDARIAGEWFGTPATEIRDGLIRGFISEANANATIIPEGTTGIDSIDGSSLSSLLRGGMGSCSQPSPQLGDQDTLNGMDGWYFYLNFAAAQVPYTEL